jgi:Sulfotransferase domain
MSVESTNPVTAVTSADGDAGSQNGQGQPGRAPDRRAWSSDSGLARPGRTGWQRQAVRAVRRSVVIAGQTTHRARMLPSFLIAGAQRCGTTSLFHVLSQHPAVFSPLLGDKELHYFDHEYNRGLGWYQSHFPTRAWARAATRRSEIAPVAFEGSPYYMFHPLAPSRINRDLPGVRLLVLVRDPVERAYSHHAHQVGLGLESEPFERALELEDSRIDGEAERIVGDPGYFSRSHWLYAYRGRGHYADQLEHLESIFGRNRILVIDSGDFFAEPGPVYDQVLDFLGLPHRGQPVFTPQNARPRAPMPEAVRAKLEEHYRPHDERLAAWLGRDPSWRR